MAIKKAPLYQQAYDAVRNKIISGELAPGATFAVQTIADEYDISRTPVREAIRQLTQEGLLEAMRDGRVRVYSPSVEALAEIYLVRASLEASAASAAVVRRPKIDMSALWDAHQRGVAAVEANDWVVTAQTNTEFHDQLVGLAENATARRILDSLRYHVINYRRLSMQFPPRRTIAVKIHGKILELMREGDAEAVGAKVHAHVLMSGAWAITNLKPQPEGDTPSMQYLRHIMEHYSTE